MKKIFTKLFLAAVAVIGFSVTASAQSSATATASATLIVPISIAKTADMNFGTVAASATAGTIVLAYDGTTTATGGASKVSGTPSAAAFEVTGEGASSFSISHPTTITLISTALDEINVIDILAQEGISSTLLAGTKVITVKGTLDIPADQVAGTYTNDADLTVTVNYN